MASPQTSKLPENDDPLHQGNNCIFLKAHDSTFSKLKSTRQISCHDFGRYQTFMRRSLHKKKSGSMMTMICFSFQGNFWFSHLFLSTISNKRTHFHNK
mmetsp:Transcript_27462/g.51003  ORF Transcript_27462/g.51003 Transcript_27462/m.51003 type:complete len:98 (+) Transcript_27462:244-537(+)